MKKTMLIIVSFVLTLLTMSAFVDVRRSARIGSEAPAFVVERADSSLSLDGLRGKKVVLSFWSAADAQSRLDQNRLASAMRHAGEGSGTAVVSVNLDRSEKLMKEIASIDHLDEDSQFHVGDAAAARAIREVFEMADGLRTFIIDERGIIVKVDPSEKELAQALAS